MAGLIFKPGLGEDDEDEDEDEDMEKTPEITPTTSPAASLVESGKSERLALSTKEEIARPGPAEDLVEDAQL